MCKVYIYIIVALLMDLVTNIYLFGDRREGIKKININDSILLILYCHILHDDE